MNHYLFFNHISICDSSEGCAMGYGASLFLAYCCFASIVIQLAAHPSKVGSIVWDKRTANCSIIEKIPPKGESFSDFIATFAMSVGFDTYFDLQH